ncbi:hypothetical protein ACHAWF_015495 [Thalassiosira exigua]
MAKRSAILWVAAATCSLDAAIAQFNVVSQGVGNNRYGGTPPNHRKPRTPLAFASKSNPWIGAGVSLRPSNARIAALVPLSSTAASDTSNDSQAARTSTGQPNYSPAYPLIILIGGSGFLGTEIRKQLRARGVEYVATSTPASADDKKGSGEEDFEPLDLTAADAEDQFRRLVATKIEDADGAKKIAVISAMGAIGTDRDREINAAQANAVKGAHRANEIEGEGEGDDVVERFVVIGNAERVRRLARKVPFLKGYASGKDVSAMIGISFYKNALRINRMVPIGMCRRPSLL